MSISIKDELAKLIQIQMLDSQLVVFKQQAMEEKPALIAKLKQEFEAKKEALKKSEERLKAALLKKKDRETRLLGEEEGIRKATAHLYQLKTNKEYKAKMNEIESLKGNVSLLEEEILKVMDEITVVEKDVEREKKVMQGIENEFKQQEGTLKEEIDELTAQIRIVADKKKALIVHVDKKVAALYEDLIANCGGLAVVTVRDNSCGGCYMRVTHQHVNEIRMYEEMIRCGSCSRIMYLEEDFVDKFVDK
jgi:predicted  nucleic acid-binding Zn-ribbon protein